MQKPPATRKAQAPQPLEVLGVDDALLNVQTVSVLTGWSPTTVWRRVRDGTLPKPVKLSPGCTRWRAQDVRKCLASAAA